jgi:hypothetical protein
MEHRVTTGLEDGTEGRIGRDPRTMGQEELRALGHEPMPVLSAIRAHCLDCCGGSPSEVRMCTAVRCPSWPFRMGTNPWRAPMSEEQRAAAALRLRQRRENPPNGGGNFAGTPSAATSVPAE